MNIGTESTAHGSRLENCQPELSLQIPDYFIGRSIVIRQTRFPFNNTSNPVKVGTQLLNPA